VIPANIQDRDCAANLIRKTRHLFPWLAKIFADGGYAGEKLKAALAGQPVELEIVKRMDNAGGFKVVRRRWVIERTLSWLRRNRRLMAHYEAFAFIAEGFAKLAMICIMLRRLTEPRHTPAEELMSTIRIASMRGLGGSAPNRPGGSPFSTQRQNFRSAVTMRCW